MPRRCRVSAAGYPPLLTPPALVDRLHETCTSNVASLVARTFGGPQAAVRNAASVTDQACLDRACAATNPDLFESINHTMGQAGLMSNTKPDNPFLDWTKVLLAYCTQDLHIGGGVTDVFPEITVHRYGARNVQAELRYVRDVLSTQMDATDPTSFRPDRLTVLLSGSSAGGFGAAYNYHFLLDDLQWAHTTSLQDAGLGMDNGGPDGVFVLAATALLPTSPGWGILPYFAPYCLSATCAETYINLDLVQSARLKAFPTSRSSW